MYLSSKKVIGYCGSVAGLVLLCTGPAVAEEGASNSDAIKKLQQELQQIRQEYEQRIKALEQEQVNANTPAVTPGPAPSNAFNPDISLVLDGRFASYQQNPDNYRLPGFTLGDEGGLAREGFAIGESELTLSSNADQVFRAQATVSFGNDGGSTTTSVEEAFFETLGLGDGFTIRGGRFKSAVGYLNQQHAHAWDFADAPLVYAAFWNGSYNDDGVRVSWVAPTDLYLELGAEAFAGEQFPSGGKASPGAGAKVAYLNLGGDIGDSQSWQAGVSWYTADPQQRETATATDIASFSGGSDVAGLNGVWKWAPEGNYKDRFVKVQGEYFRRHEDGIVDMLTSGDRTSYHGTQDGYYLQVAWQFMPQWRTGLRYDALHSDNRGADLVGTGVLDEAGLANLGINPSRTSAMVEWDPSEFSRIRLQFNRDDSAAQTDNQVILQYTLSLGTHGAHAY